MTLEVLNATFRDVIGVEGPVEVALKVRLLKDAQSKDIFKATAYVKNGGREVEYRQYSYTGWLSRDWIDLMRYAAERFAGKTIGPAIKWKEVVTV